MEKSNALKVEAGASNTDLDLTHLRVTRLDLQSGASDTRIRLPESAGSTSVDIATGIAGLHIEVPQGVAADIDVRNAIGNASIDEARFHSVSNGRYRSADYDTATNRVQLRVELGIGGLTVR